MNGSQHSMAVLALPSTTPSPPSRRRFAAAIVALASLLTPGCGDRLIDPPPYENWDEACAAYKETMVRRQEPLDEVSRENIRESFQQQCDFFEFVAPAYCTPPVWDLIACLETEDWKMSCGDECTCADEYRAVDELQTDSACRLPD